MYSHVANRLEKNILDTSQLQSFASNILDTFYNLHSKYDLQITMSN